MTFRLYQKVQSEGFTLLEIMVVIAIISVMSVTAVVSFEGMAEKVQVQETAAVIEDEIKRLEIEVLHDAYKLNQVHFGPDYLVVESQVNEPSSLLSYEGLGAGDCQADEIGLLISGVEGEVFLNRADRKGNKLQVYTMAADQMHCVDFRFSRALEWAFQVEGMGDESNVVRLIHFNLNRYNLESLVQIINGSDFKLNIEAPYAKKSYFQNELPIDEEVILTLSDGFNEEVLQLQ